MSEQVQVTKAVITKLKIATALTDQLTTYNSDPAVFTHVPQDLESYPYVVLYDTELNGDNNDCNLGFDGVLNIHSWSDQRDMAVIGDIQKAIYDALNHAEFGMVGYSLVEIAQEFSTILRDPDGITLHGVQRYRIILQTDN